GNALGEAGGRVAHGGARGFVAETADMAARLGAQIQTIEEIAEHIRVVVVPLVDPTSGHIWPIERLATQCHQLGARLIVDATLGLGACELRVDAWGVDACSAGVDY